MITVQEYLTRSTQGIFSFLEQCLPEIDGESWWQQTVINKLSEHQARLAEQKGFSALSDFDLAALLNLLERNWRAITERTKSLDYRRGLNLIIELKNIRNHYAHEPISGTELDQQLRDVDSITRMLKMLGADPDLITQGEALHRKLMLLFLGLKAELGAEDGIEVAPEDLLGDSDEDDQDALKEKKDAIQKGVPVHWLRAGTILEQSVLEKMSSATYVGIDFGTSSSVASIAKVGEHGQGLHTQAIEIRQLDELGREIHSHLVDTCLAWFNQKLLFGVGAARLKQELVFNQTIWTSFKMGLGVDLGPEYNRTALPAGQCHQLKPQKSIMIL